MKPYVYLLLMSYFAYIVSIIFMQSGDDHVYIPRTMSENIFATGSEKFCGFWTSLYWEIVCMQIDHPPGVIVIFQIDWSLCLSKCTDGLFSSVIKKVSQLIWIWKRQLRLHNALSLNNFNIIDECFPVSLSFLCLLSILLSMSIVLNRAITEQSAVVCALRWARGV